MLISAVIPTYKREDLLERAVNSLLNQEMPDNWSLEVIVVNDADEKLSSSAWQADSRVKLLHTHRAERCFARNAGASMSRGQYLHFLDDDDMLLPGAYSALITTAGNADSVWTYGAYRVMDRSDKLEETVRPSVCGHIFALALAGGGIPHQASLISRKAFFESGGWDPAFSVSEDQDLMLRLSCLGEFAYCEYEVAQIRRGIEGSGGDWSATSRCWQMKVEKALSRPDCSKQLTASLRKHGSSSLRGQIARKYIGSAVRHIRRGGIMLGLNRIVGAFRVCLPALLSPKLWAAITRGESR
ncbi:MAG: glycosyltransferase family A protein [Armatimonadota bacterium]|nr:glycosyltransferase family 2 protein [bacterium]